MVDEDLTQEEQRLFKFFSKAFDEIVMPRLESIDGRLDNVEIRLDRIENKLDRVAETVNDHGARIQKLEIPQALP